MSSFEKKIYESAIELKDSLRKRSFLLGEDIAESNQFIKFSNNLIDVGFIYDDLGLEPQMNISTRSNKVFLGINSLSACLDSANMSVSFEKKLPSLLYEIMIDPSSKYIMFICELDILVYESSGSLLWHMGFRNIVEDYYLKRDDSIVIECGDGDITIFSLESGKIK
ncbi:hypothetical protein C6P52_05795 [Enterococcus mundtii]|uniref:hypothetical protein n=1 Tax=Enterococcus mundtii TaxID=53346 RepID=UPI000D3B51E9|nr:hypothetical protein [Enterococcus mundtii]PTO39291.1 hypothetical protein C6P52_05795 [Enterococcus mundtii]PTO44441.1 hypothetical protein C6P54_04700 [Enterococcus mundtii]